MKRKHVQSPLNPAYPYGPGFHRSPDTKKPLGYQLAGGPKGYEITTPSGVVRVFPGTDARRFIGKRGGRT